MTPALVSDIIGKKTDTGDIMNLKKTRFNIFARVLDHLYSISIQSPELTVSDIVRAGIIMEVERMERENGGPFERAGKLKRGKRPGKYPTEPTRSVSVYMDAEHLERLRNVVYWTMQRVTTFVSEASEKYAREVVEGGKTG